MVARGGCKGRRERGEQDVEVGSGSRERLGTARDGLRRETHLQECACFVAGVGHHGMMRD